MDTLKIKRKESVERRNGREISMVAEMDACRWDLQVNLRRRVARDGKGITQLVASYNMSVVSYRFIVVRSTKAGLINESILHVKVSWQAILLLPDQVA